MTVGASFGRMHGWFAFMGEPARQIPSARIACKLPLEALARVSCKILRNVTAARVALVLMFNSASCAVAQIWTLTTAPTNEYWQAIASSADGRTLVAVSSNGIYASTT